MSVETTTCYVLICDGCKAPLVDYEHVAPHYPSPSELMLDARGLFGWSTDGRGVWHCRECPALTFDDGSHAIPGQLTLPKDDRPAAS
jgi:hypothetical protein